MHKSITLMVGSAITLSCLTTPAFAHPGHAHGGLEAGFLHPIFGLDHVLAMLLVGLIAARIGERALWLLPASFVSMMIVGGLLGANGWPLGHLELVIAASLIVFGVLSATSIRVPVLVLSLIIGAFALFHGYAHGAEMPGEADTFAYAAGFVAATALLHAVGIAAWLTVARFVVGARVIARVAGVGSALIGLGLAVGLT